MSSSLDVEVAIVGGGPAGAALATRLAAAGHRAVLFERLAAPRWRASGVYSSALTRRRLATLGLSGHELDRLIRPLGQTIIETADGSASCVLEHAPEPACGVDRVRLEQALLARAASAGAEVHEGAVVRQVALDGRRPRLRVSVDGHVQEWSARLVVGADGPSSIVSRAAGVAIATRRFRRAAVTGHRADDQAAPERTPMAARIVVGSGWYLGIAPVPGGRVNLGLVLAERELRQRIGGGRRLAGGEGVDGVLRSALQQSPAAAARWLTALPTDRLAVQLPLAHRVSRAGGSGFLLVGDAAGFIDPLSGEGLHRALVSAELAEQAIVRGLSGDRLAASDYDRHLRARFRSKDFVSWLLQLFLFRPALAAYALRRLRRRPAQRRQFARVLSDLAPASGLADPRFIGRLLAP